jgi:hypothetical protein
MIKTVGIASVSRDSNTGHKSNYVADAIFFISEVKQMQSVA